MFIFIGCPQLLSLCCWTECCLCPLSISRNTLLSLNFVTQLKSSYSSHDVSACHITLNMEFGFVMWNCILNGLNSEVLHENTALLRWATALQEMSPERKILSSTKWYQVLLSLKTICLSYTESRSAVRCFNLNFTLN